jgi:RimJ/RimL family protein N-acetyltransferase
LNAGPDGARGAEIGCQDSTVRRADDCLTTTDRLLIRPWRLEEADRFFDIHRRYEVARWLSGVPMKDRQEAVTRLEGYSSTLATDPRFGAWAVVERGHDLPAGTVLLKPLPDGEGEIEIGWHLHPDSWGRGLATEAAGAVLRHGFSSGLNEVWAVTYLDNDRSIAVCRKIGMRLLGITHRWYSGPSLMFWSGARAGQEPSLDADEPAPASASADL